MSLAVDKKSTADWEKQRAKQDVAETYVAKKGGIANEEESKNEGSAASSTTSAEAPARKFTPSGLPQDYFIVSSCTSSAVKLCINTFFTDHKLSQVEFILS